MYCTHLLIVLAVPLLLQILPLTSLIYQQLKKPKIYGYFATLEYSKTHFASTINFSRNATTIFAILRLTPTNFSYDPHIWNTLQIIIGCIFHAVLYNLEYRLLKVFAKLAACIFHLTMDNNFFEPF